MKPHGLLFTGQMILPLLNTKPDVWPAQAIDPAKPFKWQTRRTMKFQPKPEWTEIGVEDIGHATKGVIQQATYRAFPEGGSARWAICECPHPVGQIIYARETWQVAHHPPGHVFKATLPIGLQQQWRWKPGIHMPKAIARLWFVVKRVRVERVNQISEADCIAEGITRRRFVTGNPFITGAGNATLSGETQSAVSAYLELFDSINGQGAFERGDWVWVYDLARISKPKDV